MERKTHVRRNRGLKDGCRGQQTRDIDPRQQHILRMLYPATAATLWLTPLHCGSVEDKCCSRYWGVPEHAPLAPRDWHRLPGGGGAAGKRSCPTWRMLIQLPAAGGGELTPSSWRRAASSGGQAGQEEGTGSPAAEAGRQSPGAPVRRQRVQ